MEIGASLEKVYRPTEDIVAREIEGEVIIVPLVGTIGDRESEFYALNETGRAIWRLLDGTKPLSAVAESLSEEFEGTEIEQDVLGFVTELLRRGIVVEVS
ncbi:MAG: PqqD family protein [Thermodesulfobacteriota bacterium]